MLIYVVVVTIASLLDGGFAGAQATECIPNAPPTDAQLARRRAAITVARQINTAEARQWQTSQRYLPLSELQGVTVPDGFEVQVSTDAISYTFSVKDAQDACKFAVFSDQIGLIYTAAPLR